MRIRYLQHVEFEGPGALVEWAARRGHELEGTYTYRAGFEHPADSDMLVVLGGPMGVDQELEHPWLAAEKAFIRRAIGDGALVAGICLGAQLVADVLGASVTRNPEPEIGWYPVDLTAQGRASEVFGGLPARFETLHWHGDTFAIPPGATHAATSAACLNQAFEYDRGRVIGLQFHLEATPESWSTLCARAADHLTAGGEWVSSVEEMLGKHALFEPANEMFFGILDRMAAAHARV